MPVKLDLSDYQLRWARAQELMEKESLDALFITEMHNYWYFTGHRSVQFEHKMRPFMMILPREGDPTLIIYGRDEAEARTACGIREMRTYVDVPFPLALISDTFHELGLSHGRIGCELGTNHRLGLPFNDFMELTTSLLPHAAFVDGSPVISRCRLIKTPGELQVMREAGRITLAAWDQTLQRITPGMDTRRVTEILTMQMIEQGGDTHHTGHILLLLEGEGGHHVYQKGDLIWCDFGASYQGYRCDIARHAVLGVATDEQKRNHAVIVEATQACIDACAPGNRASDVARAANRVLTSYGYPPLVGTKRVGHGLGISVAEPPSLGMGDDTILEPGMVLTPEPRFFIPSGARIHIEENVVITETGCELLTTGGFNLPEIPC